MNALPCSFQLGLSKEKEKKKKKRFLSIFLCCIMIYDVDFVICFR